MFSWIISLLIPILINMTNTTSSLALVTGASTGIGYELAKCSARYGYNLLIAADEPRIHDAAANLRSFGVQVEAIEADLATFEGVDKFYGALKGRPVGALLANAGRGLGKSFLDQEVNAWRHVVDTNITGTLYLIQKIARDMLNAGLGRIMITGSLAGLMPGHYQAYNGTNVLPTGLLDLPGGDKPSGVAQQDDLQEDLGVIRGAPCLIIAVFLLKTRCIQPGFHQRMDGELQGPGHQWSSKDTGRNTLCR